MKDNIKEDIKEYYGKIAKKVINGSKGSCRY